jgi:hypothetical protein
MRRDPHSKAIVFPPDPHKKAIKDQRKRADHQVKEIQFLADCINYQQDLINKQSKVIEDLHQQDKQGKKDLKTKTTEK